MAARDLATLRLVYVFLALEIGSSDSALECHRTPDRRVDGSAVQEAS
jgi:hypothetical protein